MEELAVEVRRALAAVSLAQSIALSARPVARRGGAGRGQRGSPLQGDGGTSSRHWSYGQLRTD